ncbi:hydroxyacylglutathione hydrolase [Corynebacterium pollutisoli]|uniref:Hydroxyacylglutathione hydrolase n=1 Tax=Corynebacterium pollutisoli TaxID=1610489 RepID=A0A1X7HWM9_9CORY|nr:MBL fold metallo-hydrolase [Corynebacterium pollutisoli]NLP40158.1 MBL fold metallo-hydrolase [Corynebacterium pollutisoli]SMG06386.1 hydroxyacylglutathione hydrolase [Corynebacterium pollutisoli]HJD78607.1 MBL fold metallo-hydrolase [Corynebacterium pollutisoli]
MLLERFYDEDLAQASYFIGCQAQNTAVVVDARRDITEYLDLAEHHGMEIVAVTETHIHADYLSGTRELAAATGAKIYLSGEGGEDWQYGFEGELMYDKDTIQIGNITIEARHTPGHTPEHLSFLITDGAFADTPGYMLSGDFIFSGDLGRPDLLDEAAGGVDTRFGGAKDIFRSLKEVFLQLDDHVQVYPAHGAGSACGKALGALPSTTVGYERNYAWWAPYLKNDDEQGFVDELLDGQPDAHAYFGRMKRQNKSGPAVLGYPLPELPEVEAAELADRIESGDAIVVDTRHHSEVHEGTVKDAVNVPGLAKAATYGSWVYDPETDTADLIVLAADAEEAAEYRDHFIRVGIDEITGFITGFDGLPMVTPEVLSQDKLFDAAPDMLLDLRNKTEHADGHIPGSYQLSGGRVLWNLDELPAPGESTIISYCQSGVRNSVAASALRRKGYDVQELEGSYLGYLDHQNKK